MSTTSEAVPGAGPAADAPPAFDVGELQVQVVTDGGLDYTLDFLFPEAPDDEVQAGVAGRLDAAGELRVPYDCLLVSTPSQTVLIDAGFGPTGAEGGSTAGRLPASLAAAGVAPADIDVVVITHAHVDHIGGLVHDGRLAFPNARHVLSRAEWDCWTSEEVLRTLPDVLADSARAVLPVLDRTGVLDLVEGETEVVPGVHLLPAPGHTPGHCAVAVRSGQDQVLFLADAVLDELQFAHPQWTSVPDMAPDQLIATRIRLLEEAADSAGLVLAFHVSGIGHVERHHGGFHFSR